MNSENKKEYISSLARKSEAGDVFAMEELATFYYEENSELMNDNTIPLVLDLYEKAASAGHQRACLNLGEIYYDGFHAKQDYTKAIKLFKSAISGDSARIAAIAAAKLGDCYFYGKGVETDYSKAFDCYLEGVLLCEHPLCLCKLGDMYSTGSFVNQDSEKAYFIYSKAKKCSERFFNDSLADTLIRMAQAKLDGSGTEKDNAVALKYLKMAKRIPQKFSHSKNILQEIDALIEKTNKA